MPTLISDPAGRAEFARQQALTLGFDAVGICAGG
jgi:epoxyqueuosine reductase